MRKLPLIAAGAVVVGAVLWVRKNPTRKPAPGTIQNALDPRIYDPADVVSGKVAEAEADWVTPPDSKQASFGQATGAAAAAASAGFLAAGPVGAAFAFAATWLATSGLQVGFGVNGPTAECFNPITGQPAACSDDKCIYNGTKRTPCANDRTQMVDGVHVCADTKYGQFSCVPFSGKWVKQ